MNSDPQASAASSAPSPSPVAAEPPLRIRAAIRTNYRLRLVAMAVLFSAFAAWFLYDGFVSYPHQAAIYREYQQFVTDGRADQWAEYAQQRNWPDGTGGQPGKDRRSEDILMQKVLGFLVLPVGLLYLGAVLTSLRKWVELDGQTLRNSAGDAVALSDIAEVDRRRWDSKGIAVVHFTAAGKPRRIVLDDWKYETEATRAIYKQVQAASGAATQPGPAAEPLRSE